MVRIIFFYWFFKIKYVLNPFLKKKKKRRRLIQLRIGFCGESNAGIIAKMAAVLGDQIIRIPSILFCEILHHCHHFQRRRISFPIQNQLRSHCFGSPTKIPVSRLLMSSKRILHFMNCIYTNSRLSILTRTQKGKPLNTHKNWNAYYPETEITKCA